MAKSYMEMETFNRVLEGDDTADYTELFVKYVYFVTGSLPPNFTFVWFSYFTQHVAHPQYSYDHILSGHVFHDASAFIRAVFRQGIKMLRDKHDISLAAFGERYHYMLSVGEIDANDMERVWRSWQERHDREITQLESIM